jgi:uncharacterized membrane protein YphA (DoxX/SURF4 family)
MQQIQQVASQFEATLSEKFTTKARKRFLSTAGPTLLVLTFVEDGLRIFLRWGEQHQYMTRRMGMGSWTGTLMLLLSAAVQLGGSALILRPNTIKPTRVKPASYLLLTFVALQPFMYGQATDADFMCRSITLAGGFLLLIWSENERKQAEDYMGLPQAERSAAADKLQLSGRLLLTFIFLFQAIHGEQGGLHSVLTKPSFFNIVRAASRTAARALAAHVSSAAPRHPPAPSPSPPRLLRFAPDRPFRRPSLRRAPTAAIVRSPSPGLVALPARPLSHGLRRLPYRGIRIT